MPARARTLVQQARRIAQIERRRRLLTRQLAALDDLLRLERRTLKQMAEGNPLPVEGKLP